MRRGLRGLSQDVPPSPPPLPKCVRICVARSLRFGRMASLALADVPRFRSVRHSALDGIREAHS